MCDSLVIAAVFTLGMSTAIAQQQNPPAQSAANNPAVNTTGTNNVNNPVAGANSFTEGQAKSRIEHLVKHGFRDTGFVAWPNTPTRRAEGSMSRNNSTLFPANAEAISDTPVMFPPGCAKLGTMPVSTGSPTMTTMGMSRVACFGAPLAGQVSRGDWAMSDDSIQQTVTELPREVQNARLSGAR